MRYFYFLEAFMSKATSSHLRIQALCEGAILLALAIVLNYLSKMIFANMPQGGSISLGMFPLLLYVHRWGVGRGLLIGFAYGLLDMPIDGGYAWGWQSMLLDYLVAYTALGLGGFFKGKVWGIFPCVAVGCAGRFAVHYFSGITLYKILVPTAVEGLESLGAITSPHLYSLLYNGVYMLPNTIIALVLAALLLKPMGKYFSGSDLRK
jgi:thiamine transporter